MLSLVPGCVRLISDVSNLLAFNIVIFEPAY